MFGNQSDKNTNQQTNNRTTLLFGGPAVGGLFGNSSAPQSTGGLFGNASAPPATGGLFGSLSVPTTSGGLFSSVTENPNSLFSNANSSTLNTSQRKQGGLFGSSKPTKAQQAPKLLFGSVLSNTSNTPLFGSNPKQTGDKKQQNKLTASFLSSGGSSPLFRGNNANSTGNLFGNITPKDSTSSNVQSKVQVPKNQGLFGSITENKPSGGLFGNKQIKTSEQPSKQNKPSTLFGSSTQNPLFANKTQTASFLNSNTQNSLFADKTGKKQPTTSFINTTAPSLFQTNTNDGAKTPNVGDDKSKKPQQKIQIQKKTQSNLFSSNINNNLNKTPKTPLFGANTTPQSGNMQEAHKFSLTGNLLTRPNQAAGSLFVSAAQKKPQQNKNILPEPRQIKNQLNNPSNLFVNTPSNQQKNVASANAGSSSSGGLFNPKAQTKPFDSSPISKIAQSGQSNVNLKSNSLFGNEQNKQATKMDIKGLSQKPASPNQIKAPQGLLATFSAEIQGQNPSKVTHRQTRTISFNQSHQTNQNIELKPQSSMSQKPLTHSSLFNETQSKSVNQKPHQGGLKLSMTESTVIRPSNDQSKIDQSKIGKSKMAQQSFFKSQNTQKTSKDQTILTAFQINNLIREKVRRESLTSEGRNSGDKLPKQVLKSIQEWISVSFSRLNQVPVSEVRDKRYALHSNQDINRFLNDVSKQVILLVNLPFQQKSFRLVNKLFDELLNKLGIKQYLFNCTKIQPSSNSTSGHAPNVSSGQAPCLQIVQLNTSYFLKHKIYKFAPQVIQLNLDSQQLQHYIVALAKKFITNQLEYLEYLQNKPQLLKLPFNLFYQMLKYCLNYKKLRFSSLSGWNQKNPELVVLVQDFEKKIIRMVVSMLSGFLTQNFYSFLLLNKQYLAELIGLIENFTYNQEEDIVDLSLKVILNNIELGLPVNSSNKLDVNLSPQIRSSIKETKSVALLPFRTLLSILQNSSNRLTPSSHDLYRYINGPEWLDWLQIYLSSGNGSNQKQVPIAQARYLIKILRYPSLNTKTINRERLSPKESKYIQNLQKKILSRKRPIYKFIIALKQENMLNIFYEVLMSLIYDYESYRRIEELFFKQKDEFNYEFRNVIAEISNYPTQKFKEEIPFMQEKFLYFLRVVQVAPERTLVLQKLIFQSSTFLTKKQASKDYNNLGTQFKDNSDYSQVGHKICHFLIDGINYFGLKNNQLIVAKCISAIKSLLLNVETSLAMKIAMAVNKPDMVFISSSLQASSQPRLIQSLISQMAELLEYFLVSQEFVKTIAVNMRTNNSDDANLERMYAVRYSDKDYLPFVKQLINAQFLQAVGQKQVLSTENVILTFSTFWILKTLQVLVQALKQQTVSSSSNDRKFLHLLNLILQKFFIPLSHGIQEQGLANSMIQETSQRSNNPIYSTSASNLIPKALLYMVEALNTVDIVSILGQNLKYKLLRSGHVFDSKTLSKKINYYLSNQKLEEDFASNQNSIFLSLKILKQLLHTYRLYEQYKNSPAKQGALSSRSGQNHFMYKVLTRLKWIQDLQFSLFLKSYARTDIVQSGQQSTNSKTNLLMGLIALLLVDNKNQRGSQNLLNQTQESKPINLKQQNYEKPFIIPIESGTQINKKSSSQLANFSVIQGFYNKYGQTLNYEAINNFIIVSPNRYLESYESLQGLAIECLTLMISGETVFGQKSCSHFLQSSINIAKYAGFYNVIAISQTPNEVFSNQWLLQSLQVQLLSLLCERQSTIQTKRAILDFMCQIFVCDKANSNFMIAKSIFYKYLVRHLNQFQIYSDEQMVSLNLKVIKMLNTLYQKDNSYFNQQISSRLLDTLISKMVATCSRCLKSSQNLIKLVRSFQSKQYYETDLAYYHLERTVEQRQIIKTGEAYELLKEIIELVQKKFFDTVNKQSPENGHKWKCIRKINALIINLNLSYLTSTIIDQNISKSHLREIILNQSTSKVLINTNLPRYFSKVPLQLYLTTARNISDVYAVFDIYKTNIIDWVSFYSIGLGQKALHFLNWILTVDRNLYGNQPVTLKSRQFYEKNSSNIICSLHMGNYKHSAVQLFADSQNQAINLTKNLYDDSIRSLQKGMTVNQAKCFSIMGYCLEWLRARQNTHHILQHLVKYTIKNTFWLDQKTLQNRSVIKFVLSLVSIGSEFLGNSEFKNIRQPILDLIHRFKQGKSQLEQTMIQELISVIICIPPQIEDSRGLNEILTLWKSQTNNEFFYNQSRMVLQICSRYPNQVAKLKALSLCDRIKKSISGANYSYSLRHPDSMCLIWGLKVASTLMSSQVDTVVIFQEISQYYALNSEHFFNILLKTPSTITLGYIQELQALLQFFLTLISSKEWLIVHRKQFQKLTYVLSHKLINLFTDFINSKINFSAQSDMQKRFKKLRLESLVDQNKEQSQNFNTMNQIVTDKDSVFRMLMELKMIECMKTFTVLLSHSLQESWYVHKYFNEQVYENYRYGVSFWDRMNKSIMDIIRFNVITQKKWKKSQKLNQKLNLINDCINSSEYFVETGYLSSVYNVASTRNQLFAQLHCLNLSSFQLGTVHLIQQKGFRQKYQCLMKGNIQKYGKRLQQSIKTVQGQFQSDDINSWNSISLSIKPAPFSDMLRNIAHLIKTI